MQEPRLDQNDKFCFDVFGLWCSTCSRSLEESLKKIPGVVSASVHFGNSQAHVETSGSVSQESLDECARNLGYSFLPALSSADDTDFKKTKNQYLLRLAVVTFSSMWALAFSLAYYAGEGTLFIYLSSAVAIPGILYGIIPFFRATIISLKSRVLSFDVLIVIANLSLFVASIANLSFQKSPVFFDSIVMTISIVLWARYLEVILRFNTRAGLITSLSGTLSNVLVHIQGQWIESPAQKIRVGRLVRFEKNTVISLDGALESESGLFDLSFISGESTPIKLSRGEIVKAGSKLKSDIIEIKVTAPVGQRWIDSLYLEAIQSKTKGYGTSRFEKILRFWIPTVLILSLLVGIINLLLTGDLLRSISIFSATLLVTCPCSLILAEPLSRLWLKKRLATQNIQLNADWFSKRLEKIWIVFDKTGTLITKEDFLTDVTVFDKSDLELCKDLIRSCCHENRHPTTHELFLNQDLSKLDTSGVRNFTPGAGVTWTRSNGEVVRFGKSSWISVDDRFKKYQSLLEVNSQIKAGLSILPIGEPAIVNSLKKLTHLGHRVAVLSGDKEENCFALVKSQAFDFVLADCSPEDKKNKIQELKCQGKTVIFVGDGINDVLAMTESDFSIAVRTDISAAQSASDLVVSANQLENLDWIFEQFGIAKRKVNRSLKFGLFYNAVMIPLALTGMLHPLAAVFAMAASSLLITTSSLYTRKQFKLIGTNSGYLKSAQDLIHP
jgi:cation transport ATPase